MRTGNVVTSPEHMVLRDRRVDRRKVRSVNDDKVRWLEVYPKTPHEIKEVCYFKSLTYADNADRARTTQSPLLIELNEAKAAGLLPNQP